MVKSDIETQRRVIVSISSSDICDCRLLKKNIKTLNLNYLYLFRTVKEKKDDLRLNWLSKKRPVRIDFKL